MKLKVLSPFRDIDNFAVRHEAGDVVVVTDPDRIRRLVSGGLCEMMKATEETTVEPAENETPTAAASEKPKAKKRTNRR